MWNPLAYLQQSIQGRGGFVNAHAHFDRAYSVTQEDFNQEQGGVESHLHQKWLLVDRFKKESSQEKYLSHIQAALRSQKEMGTKVCLSFIDCDPVAEMKAILASQEAKKWAATQLQMKFLTAVQTLKGVIQREAREYFEKSLEYVDIIGGLPGADKGQEATHLDILLKSAKETGKRAHIHVDQLNCATEKETEMLCQKVMQWGMEGKVTAVHGISIAAHPEGYRKQVYHMCRDAGLSFVACPTAWIDSRRSEVLSPTHNALTPLEEMVENGICVALGSDNICDLYKPFANGDMMVELRVLLEGTHFYHVPTLLDVATSNGLKVLGLPQNV